MTIKDRSLLIQELIDAQSTLESLPELKKMPSVEVGEVLEELEDRESCKSSSII
jgi:hypothetical protein